MKKVTLLLVVIFAMFTIVAVAQNESGSSSNPSSTQSSQAPATSSQSSSQSSTQMSPSSTSNAMEGCVVAVEKDYYLQPIDGSSKVKLTGSHDFSGDVGHHVKVKGTQSTASASSSTNPSAAANPSASTSAAGGQGQEFMVTEVDTIASSCPAAGANPSANPH